MGGVCCAGRTKEPVKDCPAEGVATTFIIHGTSLVGNEFVACDGELAPWLKFSHSGNLDHHSGTIKVSMVAGNEADALLTVEVSEASFKELAADSVQDNQFFQALSFLSEDKQTMIKWQLARSVKFKDKDSNVVGELVATYEGMAQARKDVSHNRDTNGDGFRDRDVHWSKWAKCTTVDFDLRLVAKPKGITRFLGGASKTSCKVENSLIRIDQPWWQTGVGSSNIPYAQKYKVTGGPDFAFEYQSLWGLDQVKVDTTEAAPQVLAAAAGFMIAYWMHPRRMEDISATKAEELLRNRLGFWGSS